MAVSYHNIMLSVVTLILQWFLVLDQLQTERRRYRVTENCQCSKAKDLIKNCHNLKHYMSLIFEYETEMKDPVFRDLVLCRLLLMVDELGDNLNSNVSIRIPVRKSSISYEKRETAEHLMMSVTEEIPRAVSCAMDHVIRYIEHLLNTKRCDHVQGDLKNFERMTIDPRNKI